MSRGVVCCAVVWCCAVWHDVFGSVKCGLV